MSACADRHATELGGGLCLGGDPMALSAKAPAPGTEADFSQKQNTGHASRRQPGVGGRRRACNGAGWEFTPWWVIQWPFLQRPWHRAPRRIRPKSKTRVMPPGANLGSAGADGHVTGLGGGLYLGGYPMTLSAKAPAPGTEADLSQKQNTGHASRRQPGQNTLDIGGRRGILFLQKTTE